MAADSTIDAIAEGISHLATSSSDATSKSTNWADMPDSPASPASPSASEAHPPTNAPVGAAPSETRLVAQNGGNEVEVELNEEIRGNDALYHGLTSFEEMGLAPELLKGVYAAGFEAPSKIQEKAIPLLLHNPPQNLIAQSQSGTGKTAAFSLSLLSRVDPTVKSPQAIVLAPARELARQIYDVIRELGKFSTIETALLVKDSYERNMKDVPAQIIVGTPGTVVDLARKRVLPMQGIKFFCLDEADNMLDVQGLGDQSVRVRQLVSGRAGQHGLRFAHV